MSDAERNWYTIYIVEGRSPRSIEWYLSGIFMWKADAEDFAASRTDNWNYRVVRREVEAG